MKIHEYQGKELFRQYGVPVPQRLPGVHRRRGRRSGREAGRPGVGGEGADPRRRPRQGRRRQARAARSTRCGSCAGEILGMQLVTHQTGPEGQKVRRLLVEEGADIRKELYVGMVTDRATQRVALMASAPKAAWTSRKSRTHTPEKIHQGLRRSVDRPHRRARPTTSPPSIGVPDRACAQARARAAGRCTSAFWDTDASLAEINPLILDGDGRVDRARREVQLRRQRAVPPSRHRRVCATSTKKTRPRSRLASSTSPTSSSTATSAAWSTAPAWRWRPWTPSSCSAASRPTSSTSAAAPRPRRSPKRSRSC